MKRNIVISLLVIVAVFALGLRGRYSPTFWRTITGGIYYDQGNVAISGALNFGADVTGTDAYVITISGITAYTTGMVILFDPNTDNTGACTLNINGLGAKALKTPLAGDPGDDWIDDAQIVLVCYDGTNFVILTYDSNP